MMTRYFYIALIALPAALLAASAGASNRRGPEPPAPDEGSAWAGESGTASYYGTPYHGRRSASGAVFDQMALTAAHPWLPFGTKVKVTLAGTTRTVVVTITDRLNASRRIVDLSVAAARQLGMINLGIATVSLLPV